MIGRLLIMLLAIGGLLAARAIKMLILDAIVRLRPALPKPAATPADEEAARHAVLASVASRVIGTFVTWWAEGLLDVNTDDEAPPPGSRGAFATELHRTLTIAVSALVGRVQARLPEVVDAALVSLSTSLRQYHAARKVVAAAAEREGTSFLGTGRIQRLQALKSAFTSQTDLHPAAAAAWVSAGVRSSTVGMSSAADGSPQTGGAGATRSRASSDEAAGSTSTAARSFSNQAASFDTELEARRRYLTGFAEIMVQRLLPLEARRPHLVRTMCRELFAFKLLDVSLASLSRADMVRKLLVTATFAAGAARGGEGAVSAEHAERQLAPFSFEHYADRYDLPDVYKSTVPPAVQQPETACENGDDDLNEDRMRAAAAPAATVCALDGRGKQTASDAAANSAADSAVVGAAAEKAHSEREDSGVHGSGGGWEVDGKPVQHQKKRSLTTVAEPSVSPSGSVLTAKARSLTTRENTAAAAASAAASSSSGAAALFTAAKLQRKAHAATVAVSQPAYRFQVRVNGSEIVKDQASSGSGSTFPSIGTPSFSSSTFAAYRVEIHLQDTGIFRDNGAGQQQSSSSAGGAGAALPDPAAAAAAGVSDLSKFSAEVKTSKFSAAERGETLRWVILKRYSDFIALQRAVAQVKPVVSSSLPSKTLMSTLTVEHLEQRRGLLESFLQDAVRQVLVRKDKLLRSADAQALYSFLTTSTDGAMARSCGVPEDLVTVTAAPPPPLHSPARNPHPVSPVAARRKSCEGLPVAALAPADNSHEHDELVPEGSGMLSLGQLGLGWIPHWIEIRPRSTDASGAGTGDLCMFMHTVGIEGAVNQNPATVVSINDVVAIHCMQTFAGPEGSNPRSRRFVIKVSGDELNEVFYNFSATTFHQKRYFVDLLNNAMRFVHRQVSLLSPSRQHHHNISIQRGQHHYDQDNSRGGVGASGCGDFAHRAEHVAGAGAQFPLTPPPLLAVASGTGAEQDAGQTQLCSGLVELWMQITKLNPGATHFWRIVAWCVASNAVYGIEESLAYTIRHHVASHAMAGVKSIERFLWPPPAAQFYLWSPNQPEYETPVLDSELESLQEDILRSELKHLASRQRLSMFVGWFLTGSLQREWHAEWIEEIVVLCQQDWWLSHTVCTLTDACLVMGLFPDHIKSPAS